MLFYSILKHLLLSVFILHSAHADYTNPARIEEVEKKTIPADEERSGDKEKAKNKKDRYEKNERKIKPTNEKIDELKKMEHPST